MMQVRIVVIASLLVLLTGCLFKSDTRKCHKKQEYQKAEVGQQVTTPSDLESLDPSIRLDIPTGEIQTKPIPKDEPCLTDPPLYSEKVN